MNSIGRGDGVTASTIVVTREDVRRWRACYSTARLDALYPSPVPLRDVLTRTDGPWADVTPRDRAWTACRALVYASHAGQRALRAWLASAVDRTAACIDPSDLTPESAACRSVCAEVSAALRGNAGLDELFRLRNAAEAAAEAAAAWAAAAATHAAMASAAGMDAVGLSADSADAPDAAVVAVVLVVMGRWVGWATQTADLIKIIDLEAAGKLKEVLR